MESTTSVIQPSIALEALEIIFELDKMSMNWLLVQIPHYPEVHYT
jgi:hypothetical protein